MYVNGVAQNEPYAQQPRDDGDPNDALQPLPRRLSQRFAGIGQAASDNHASYWAIDLPNHIVNGDLVVPEGTVFAMGDNRTKSLDGRYWGFVPRENIVGRPMFVYWSFQTPADQMTRRVSATALRLWGMCWFTFSIRLAGTGRFMWSASA